MSREHQIINGRYRIIELLGRGAFGSVYLAHDLKLLQKPVVIKITHQPADDYESTAFDREARTLAAVSGPNIVGLIDSGTTEDGYSYIVREYIDGETLETILKRAAGPIDVVFAIRIAIAVAKGLRSLHRVGIIHRDVKPSNIIVPDNPDGAKLMDFGVVGELEREKGVTQKGQLFGTPLYMAPEQLRAEPQSPSADIYSLGVMLYEMIYGTVPFAGESVNEVIFGKLAGQVTFPSVKAVPLGISEFIRRSMSVAPEGRPQSADQVMEELHRLEAELDALNRTLVLSDASQHSYSSTNAPMASTATLANPARVPKSSAVNPLPVFLLAIGTVVLATFVWLLWGVRYQVIGILVGILLTAGGFAVSRYSAQMAERTSQRGRSRSRRSTSFQQVSNQSQRQPCYRGRHAHI